MTAEVWILTQGPPNCKTVFKCGKVHDKDIATFSYSESEDFNAKMQKYIKIWIWLWKRKAPKPNKNIQCRVVVLPTEAKWKRYWTSREVPTCRVCTALREKKESLLMWKTLCSEPSSPASLAAASLGCPPVCFCLPPAARHPPTNSRLTGCCSASSSSFIPVSCLPSTLLHITGFLEDGKSGPFRGKLQHFKLSWAKCKCTNSHRSQNVARFLVN